MAHRGVATEVLDYLYPSSVLASILAVLIFDWLTLRTIHAQPPTKRGRKTALVLTWAVLCTYLVEVLLNLINVVKHRARGVPEHHVNGTLGCMYVWGVLSVALITFDRPVWDPFIAAWVLALAFEAAICGLSASSLAVGGAASSTRLLLQVVRIACTACLVLNVVRILQKREVQDPESETEPLLSPDGNTTDYSTTGNAAGPAQKKAKAGEGENDPDKELKEAQLKRLESHGGWLGYIKEFKIFIPYLIPFKNRKAQLCIVLVAINIVLERFVNVMVPRQLGIITDKLAKDYRVMPWKAVLVWVVLRWANSWASFGLVADIAQTYLHNWSSTQIKQMAFRHVMALSMDFHSNKDSGELIKSIGQADSLNGLIEIIFFQIFPILIDVVVAGAYITHLFSGTMAVVFLMIGTMFTWTSVSTTQRVRPLRRQYTDKSRAESKKMFECVSNWPTISYFNRTQYEEEQYGEAVRQEFAAQLRYYIMNSLGYAAQYLIIYIGLLTVSMMAIFQISTGERPIGNFVTLAIYWWQMMGPLHMITYQYRRMSSSTVDAERLLQLLQTEPTVKSKPDAPPLTIEKGEVVFNGVGFSYDDRKVTLADITFTVAPGQTVAFVGETGGGKSTTLKLLFRYYDVKSGGISIDGQDLRDVTLDSLREQLGVVPQDPSLFNQTIMENVRYARLEATDGEVIEACKAAAVHEKIMSFPDQYNAKVGERGVKLSGGELQRVAIARVILKNPKIVLLDEATSAVDSSIEAQIQAAFKKLSHGRTTFVVAHRLSTIMEADLIIVIDGGRIIEQGTHDELLTKGKKYFELWSKQTSGKGSNDHSKANSLLELPDDIDPASRIDSSDSKYSDELRQEFVTLKDNVQEEEDEVETILQVDGVCESKPSKNDSDGPGCFGLTKTRSTNKNEAPQSDYSGSSDSGQGGPIRMVSARPTSGTYDSQVSTIPIKNGKQMTPVKYANAADSKPDSMKAEPYSQSASTRQQSITYHSDTDTARTSDHPPISGFSTQPSSIQGSTRGPRVTIESPQPSSSSSSSSPSSSQQVSSPSNPKKSVRDRKATGYPKNMPSATESSSSSSSSSITATPTPPVQPIAMAETPVEPFAAPSYPLSPQTNVAAAADARGSRSSSQYSPNGSVSGASASAGSSSKGSEESLGGVERFTTAKQ